MAEHLEQAEERRSREERLRAMSRKLLMDFADEDDGIARASAATARPEKRFRSQLDERDALNARDGQ
jgi:hypothetical protein